MDNVIYSFTDYKHFQQESVNKFVVLNTEQMYSGTATTQYKEQRERTTI